jgi:hypothetical protein
MKLRIVRHLFLFALLLPCAAAAQQNVPRTLRYMSEWTVAPEQVDAYSKELADRVRPVFERLMADGTVTDWGTYTSLIAEDNGITHGMWFEITSLAGVDKALTELAKLPPSKIAQSASKHHDYLMRANLHRSKPSNGSNGFYYFNSTLIQPGKVGRWREWWDRYQKPMYDQFLADGWVTMYEIDSGEMHTMDPNMVYLVYVAPSADALDKINDAFLTRAKKRSSEEAQGIDDAYNAVVVAGTHRDYFARAVSYASK